MENGTHGFVLYFYLISSLRLLFVNLILNSFAFSWLRYLNLIAEKFNQFCRTKVDFFIFQFILIERQREWYKKCLFNANWIHNNWKRQATTERLNHNRIWHTGTPIVSVSTPFFCITFDQLKGEVETLVAMEYWIDSHIFHHLRYNYYQLVCSVYARSLYSSISNCWTFIVSNINSQHGSWTKFEKAFNELWFIERKICWTLKR